MNPIIRVRGLSKQYRIGARRARYGSLCGAESRRAHSHLAESPRRGIGVPGDTTGT